MIGPEIVEKIIDAAEKEIQKEIEKKERLARESKEAQIENIQRLWNNLYEEKQLLIRATKSTQQ